MNLFISDNCFLDQISHNDVDDLVAYLQDEDVSNVTPTIPSPYSKENALQFVESTIDSKHNFAIRDGEARLIGHIKVQIDPIQPHKAVIGYWLGKPYWGKGIMTEVVKRFTTFCFEQFGLTRICATCFEHNVGSARVLEKSGFTLEGIAVKHYKKNNQFYNAKLYGKVV